MNLRHSSTLLFFKCTTKPKPHTIRFKNQLTLRHHNDCHLSRSISNHHNATPRAHQHAQQHEQLPPYSRTKNHSWDSLKQPQSRGDFMDEGVSYFERTMNSSAQQTALDSDLLVLQERLQAEMTEEQYEQALKTADLWIEACGTTSREHLAHAYFIKGIILGQLNKLSGGVQLLLRAINLNGDGLLTRIEPSTFLIGLQMIVRHYCDSSNPKLALEWQDSVINYAQKYNLLEESHFERRSYILMQLNKYGEAIDDTRRSMYLQLEQRGVVHKDCQNYLQLLKYLHARERKLYKKALICLEHYINNNSIEDSKDCIIPKVELMEMLGMVHGALSYLYHVLQHSDMGRESLAELSPRIQFKIAQLHLKDKSFDDALDALELLVSTEPSLTQEMKMKIEEFQFVIKEAKKQHHRAK